MDLPGFAADALRLALTLSLPALAASLAIGLALALFELITQGQDANLSFVPRLLAVSLILFATRELLSSQLLSFTSDVFRSIALVAR